MNAISLTTVDGATHLIDIPEGHSPEQATEAFSTGAPPYVRDGWIHLPTGTWVRFAAIVSFRLMLRH